jgi:hypothetical protein
MGKGTGTCIFCGSTGRKMTKEDVYPVWLQKELNVRDVTLVTGPSRTVVRRDAGLELRLRDVCEDCNHGWMSDLEGRFKAVMAPSFRGISVELDAQRRSLVAFWTLTRWLLLLRGSQYLHGSPMRPHLDMFRWLYDHREPPSATQIWLGQVLIDEPLVTWNSVQLVGFPMEPATNRPGGVLGVFQIGRILFQIYGPENLEGRVSSLVLHPATRDYLVQIWPNDEL